MKDVQDLHREEETARQNVEIAMSVGKHWLDIVRNIRERRKTRRELIDAFRYLRKRMSKIYDRFSLNMDLDEARSVDMSSVARTKVCPDCEDKFTCLTRGEKLLAITRCIQCGTKTFYEVKQPGRVVDEAGMEGGDSYCPLAVRVGACEKCGFRDVTRVRKMAMTRWLKLESLEVAGDRGEFIWEVVDRRRLLGAQLDRRTPSGQYLMHAEKLVEALWKSKEPVIMSLYDLRDLVEPSVKEEARGFTFPGRWPDAKSEDGTLEQLLSVDPNTVHEIAYGLNMAPMNMMDALTIRDSQDPCEKAHEFIVKQRMLETEPLIKIPAEHVFGPKIEWNEKFATQTMGVTVQEPIAAYSKSAVKKVQEIEDRRVMEMLNKDLENEED